MNGVNIFLADGFEDIEALGTYDVLQRAGINAELVAISDDPFVTSSHGITIGTGSFLSVMDLDAEGTTAQDFMISPGGMPGSRNLADCKPLIKAMKQHYEAGGSLASICAAPGLVLGQLDCLEGKKFTCFDGFESGPVSKGAVFVPEGVVADGRIITGRSAGYAIAFGLKIVETLKGPEALAAVRHSMFLD